MSIKIMQEVWDRAPVDQGSLLVLLALADSADEESRTCYPGVPSLAKKSRLKDRQVRNCLRSLRDLGLIEVQRNASPVKTNLYRLTPSEAWQEMPDRQFLHPPFENPDRQFLHNREAMECLSDRQPIAPKPLVTSEEPSDTRESDLFSETGGEGATKTERQDSGFEEWWKTYPKSRNRPSKKQTEVKFRAALKKVSLDDLMRATKAYAAECEREGRIPTYVAQATTWLNQERWEGYLEDEPVDPRVMRLRHLASGRPVV